ncbi:hypothetical protein RsoM2USA_387 [Ralstonia phage RsoM2USA]|nr:hypothetical protein RsoM2USA_387 [Ralstonia phage RsoM2USA]
MADNVANQAVGVVDKAVTKALDPLSEALTHIIDATVKAGTAGINFLSEQIPDVIHQLLVWKAIQSFLPFMLGIVAMIAGSYAMYYIIKMYRKNVAAYEQRRPHGLGYDAFVEWILGLCAAGVVVMGFFGAATHMTWLQIIVAPKIYLIEYAAHLYTSMK